MLLFFMLIHSSSSTTFNLTKPDKPVCFGQYAIADEELSIKYVISGSRDFNTRVILYNPLNAILYTSAPRTRESSRIFKVTNEGVYRLCFNNKDSISKKVTFFYSKTKNLNEDLNNKDSLGVFSKSFEMLGNYLDSVNDNLNFYQVREMYYRDLSEKNNDSVLFGATCKILALVIVFALQVYTITNVFPMFASKTGV